MRFMGSLSIWKKLSGCVLTWLPHVSLQETDNFSVSFPLSLLESNLFVFSHCYTWTRFTAVFTTVPIYCFTTRPPQIHFLEVSLSDIWCVLQHDVNVELSEWINGKSHVNSIYYLIPYFYTKKRYKLMCVGKLF